MTKKTDEDLIWMFKSNAVNYKNVIEKLLHPIELLIGLHCKRKRSTINTSKTHLERGKYNNID